MLAAVPGLLERRDKKRAQQGACPFSKHTLWCIHQHNRAHVHEFPNVDCGWPAEHCCNGRECHKAAQTVERTFNHCEGFPFAAVSRLSGKFCQKILVKFGVIERRNNTLSECSVCQKLRYVN